MWVMTRICNLPYRRFVIVRCPFVWRAGLSEGTQNAILRYGRLHRKMILQPILVAIVGGSGSGKTWLADRLQHSFGKRAARLSLDDFYRDLSALPHSRRTRVNFDDPRAIDWPRVENALRACR